jgi:O-antigen ligase
LSPALGDKSPATNGLAFISLSRGAFLLFLWLALLSHSYGWQQGPFTWAAFPWQGWRIGPLSLLPLLLAIGLLVQWRQTDTWSWGDRRVTLPLAVLTALAFAVTLFHANSAPIQPMITAVLMLLLFWLIYLSALNLHPPTAVWWGLAATLALVMLAQSSVALLQFWQQQDLSLSFMGEPLLSATRLDVSIVMNGDARWLRGYGLNSHPNRLGWKVALLWLMLWPLVKMSTGKWRLWLQLALAAGLGGLLVSLSRSAWLALAVGLLVYGMAGWRARPSRFPRPSRTHLIWLLLLGGGFALFVLLYAPVLLGRISRPRNLVELASFLERARDLPVAWELLQTHPWFGVGLGQFVPAAQQLLHYAGLVHVTPLLMGVELGVVGLFCWLAVLLWPLARRQLLRNYAPATAVWLAILIISLLQPEPTPFTMQGSIMLGLAAAMWAAPTWMKTSDFSSSLWLSKSDA